MPIAISRWRPAVSTRSSSSWLAEVRQGHDDDRGDPTATNPRGFTGAALQAVPERVRGFRMETIHEAAAATATDVKLRGLSTAGAGHAAATERPPAQAARRPRTRQTDDDAHLVLRSMLQTDAKALFVLNDHANDFVCFLKGDDVTINDIVGSVDSGRFASVDWLTACHRLIVEGDIDVVARMCQAGFNMNATCPLDGSVDHFTCFQVEPRRADSRFAMADVSYEACRCGLRSPSNRARVRNDADAGVLR